MAEKKEWPPMRLGWKFNFGQYKGQTLLDVIDDNIDYITWATENSVITLDNDAYEYFKKGGAYGQAV